MTPEPSRARRVGLAVGLAVAGVAALAVAPAGPACAGDALLTIEVDAGSTWRAGVASRVQVTVAHRGATVAPEVSLRLRHPQPLQFVSASDGGWLDPATGDLAWSLGDLEPGQVRVVESVWTCEGRADVELRAEATARGDRRVEDAQSLQVWRAAGGEIAVSAPTDAARVGDLLEFQVVFRNRSPFELPALVAWAESDGSVELRTMDSTDAPGSMRRSRPSRVEAAGVGSLGVGGEARWTVSARAVRRGTASVTVGVGSDELVRATDFLGREVLVPVEPTLAYPRVRVVDASDDDDDARLDVRVTPDRPDAPWGAEQVYVIEVTNVGSHPVDGAFVRCACSAERAILRAEGWGAPRAREGAVTFETVPPLAPGATLRLVLVTRVVAFGLATLGTTVEARRLRGPPIEVRVAGRT